MYKNLTRIGIKYDTDKAFFHSFTDFYDGYFNTLCNDKLTILELGIFKGGSLKMLSEYFPNAEIHAIDIDESTLNVECDRVHTHLCSQVDFALLAHKFGSMKFDIIIDDGSHFTMHQLQSFGFLFPFLKPKGIFICEDLHTSYLPDYITCNTNPLKILEEYKNFNKPLVIPEIHESEVAYLNNNIQSVDLYYRKQNAVKCWRCKEYNIDNLSICLCGTALDPFNSKSITSVIIHK